MAGEDLTVKAKLVFDTNADTVLKRVSSKISEADKAIAALEKQSKRDAEKATKDAARAEAKNARDRERAAAVAARKLESDTEKRIKSTKDATKAATESMGSGFSKAVQFAHNLGIDLTAQALRIVEFGKSFLVAGAGGESADQAIAGLITSVQNIPWHDAIEQARDLGDAVDEIALKSRRSGGELGDAFQTMLEITGASGGGIERAKTQLENISVIAGTLNKDAGGIAREYSMMTEGVIKTKGQLFQVLQATGAFGQKTKGLQEAWQKMSEEERIARLSTALGGAAEKMKVAAPTFNGAMNQLGNAWDIMKEKVGEPIIQVLTPALMELARELNMGTPEIESFAKTMAKDVGRWVKEASVSVREGFDWIKANKDEIVQGVTDAFQNAKAVVQWIIDHKEEIAIAFGAKMAVPAIGGAINIGKAVVGAAGTGIPMLGIAGTSAAAATGTAGAAGAAGGAGLAAGASAAAIALGAFVAALGGVTFALLSLKNLSDNTGGFKSEAEQDRDARVQFLRDQMAKLKQGDAASFGVSDRARSNYQEIAYKAGTKGALEPIDSYDQGMINESQRLAKEYERLAQENRLAVRAYDDAAKSASELGSIVTPEQIAQMDASTATLAAGFQAAIDNQEFGKAQYIANLIAGSASLQESFITSAQLTSQGFDMLGTMLEDSASDFANAMRSLSKPGAGGNAPAPPKIAMSGGQTFIMKQDFRDQNPDRIAAVWTNDLARVIERRVTSGSSVPFGT